MMQCVAVCCRANPLILHREMFVLCGVVCCSVLQCVAVCCYVLQCQSGAPTPQEAVSVCCGVCSNVLWCVEVCYSVW